MDVRRSADVHRSSDTGDVLMAGGVRIQVTGAEQVAAQFKALGLKSGDLSRAFAEIGDRVAHDATVLAPKETGRLAGDVRAGKAKTRATISVGRRSVPYAGPINYGWPRRNIAPTRFMNRAADDKADYSADRIVREMERLIRQVGLG
jgi:hypothetical protein